MLCEKPFLQEMAKAMKPNAKNIKKSTMSIIDRLEDVRPGFVLTHPDLPGFSVSATDDAGMEELLDLIVSTAEFNRKGWTTFRATGSRRKTTLRVPRPNIYYW